MAQAKRDRSRTHNPAQIQGSLIAYMRLFTGLPGMYTRDDETAYWFVSNQPAPGNSILRARFPEHEPEALIDRLFAEVGQYVEAIDWMVYPGDQPSDLGQRLEARGMPGGPAGYWLWADLMTLGEPPAVPEGFRIEQVRDDVMLAEWTRVSEAGFEQELGCFYDAYARHGYGADAFSLHYTGYLKDVPVTSGTLLEAGGGATVYDISTPPAFRGQGFGSALTHRMLREIRRRGYPDTWVWSSSMAQSTYRRLGFVDTDFGIREHTWQKRGVANSREMLP